MMNMLTFYLKIYRYAIKSMQNTYCKTFTCKFNIKFYCKQTIYRNVAINILTEIISPKVCTATFTLHASEKPLQDIGIDRNKINGYVHASCTMHTVLAEHVNTIQPSHCTYKYSLNAKIYLRFVLIIVCGYFRFVTCIPDYKCRSTCNERLKSSKI